MNLLVISNMRPSAGAPTYGLFVQNQVAALSQQDEIAKLEFIGIRSRKKGPKALLAKYLGLFGSLLKRGIFSATRFDVVHVHYFFPTILFAVAYKLLRNWRAKIVVTFHGSDIYGFEPPPRLYRMAATWVDFNIFVSDGLAARYFDPQTPSAVLSAGISDRFEPHPQALNYDLVMVGALDVNKGMDRLLSFLAYYPSPLRVAVAGSGDWVAKLQAFEHPLHQLDYLGSCSAEQLVDTLNQSRFLLSLSRNESFGLVISEAMACGVPVLATRTDGAEAQVDHGRNGFLLANDDGSLNRELSALVEQGLNLTEADYQRLAQQACADASRHKLADVAVRLVEIYRRVG